MDEDPLADVRRREAIIRKAVNAADKILMDEGEGSIEELDYLTAAVAVEFLNKVFGRLQSELLAYDLKRLGVESIRKKGN